MSTLFETGRAYDCVTYSFPLEDIVENEVEEYTTSIGQFPNKMPYTKLFKVLSFITFLSM